MKKVFFLFGIGLTAIICSFQLAVQTVWDQLGIDEPYAKNTIMNNMVSESIRLPYAKYLSSVVQGDKLAAAKEMETYIKEYTKSDAFKSDYAAYRNSKKPTYEPEPMSKEAIESLKDIYNQNVEMANNPYMSSILSKEDMNSLKKGIEDLKREIEEAQDPNPNKTKWEKNYPVDPKPLLKKKLEDFLSLSASVDYNAQLTTNQYNKKIFVNPDYEKKSPEWKACFRAGKEVNAEVRTFVQAWLKEL